MKVTTLKQLGALIRDQRRQRNWTQQELADASGTLQSWLSGVEKGKGNPEFGKLMAVLRALDVTLDFQQQATASKPVPHVKEGAPRPARVKAARSTASGHFVSTKRSPAPATSKTTSRGSAQEPSVQALRKRFQKGGNK
ncbi:helix-turn-helix domain-containing protein [Salinisphaera sp.]|uniref:helix-turn-helix domain-containing protein n=1 Tax=Salinisphaera sp. TaxID=1914330 RepID=UPI002D774D71|nr:helix-turn-helix domain-containing protein [Salinisphaera sp.]HET7314775.1 helix-turn-helix domain-containing protein [Salinisphaera sp.]